MKKSKAATKGMSSGVEMFDYFAGPYKERNVAIRLPLHGGGSRRLIRETEACLGRLVAMQSLLRERLARHYGDARDPGDAFSVR